MTSPMAPPPGLRSQVNGLVFAMLLLDPDMRITEANPAAEDMLGQSVRRLVGKPIYDVLTIPDPRVASHARQPEGRLVARSVAISTATGERRVNLTLSPLVAHKGWRVLTLSDSGQDDMGEDDPREAGLRAPAVLAHEIKNPLAAIRGAGQLLARKLDPKDRPLAKVISSEVDRIASLIDRMQRLGSASSEPNAPLNLHIAIRNALSTVRAADRTAVPIREEFDPSLPAVLGNEDALEQVVINIVSNACDACAATDHPQVIVRTRYISGLIFNAIRPGRSVRLPIELTITDNGPGIDPKLREFVFEPFVTSKKSGQGLGLALVRRLVRDMEGRITHERDEREGLTHFRVHLPVAR